MSENKTPEGKFLNAEGTNLDFEEMVALQKVVKVINLIVNLIGIGVCFTGISLMPGVLGATCLAIIVYLLGGFGTFLGNVLKNVKVHLARVAGR